MKTKIAVAATMIWMALSGAALADTHVSTGTAERNIEPRLVRDQPKGCTCVYAGKHIAVGDTIRLTDIGIIQACVAGNQYPVLVTVTADER